LSKFYKKVSIQSQSRLLADAQERITDRQVASQYSTFLPCCHQEGSLWTDCSRRIFYFCQTHDV